MIFTNASGKRFVREEDKKDLGGFTFYDMALVQPNLVIWTVFDEAAAKKKENLQTGLKYANISTFFIVVSFTREMG